MSQMSTKAVFKCKYCGRPVYVPELRTTKPDPHGQLLDQFMKNLHKIAKVCPRCRNKLHYLQSQGREKEFWSGQIVPIDIDKLNKLAGGK